MAFPPSIEVDPAAVPDVIRVRIHTLDDRHIYPLFAWAKYLETKAAAGGAEHWWHTDELTYGPESAGPALEPMRTKEAWPKLNIRMNSSPLKQARVRVVTTRCAPPRPRAAPRAAAAAAAATAAASAAACPAMASLQH